ncbi:cytochrome P450 [Nesidiocoris tenuis]|uniref:Cytochrome P450 n=1 Tax=Nesidiocoris tenuis TaxID=355587 RepID=A0ABN7B419_9HEMI|nr:cytochrome P450 [Nesidiocoris tenuis]
MWLLCLLFVAVFVLFILQQIFHIPPLRTILKFARLPGPVRIPFVGLALELLFVEPWDSLNLINKYCKQYNDFFNAYVLGVPIAVLQDPDDIKVVLSSNYHIDKGVYYKFLEPWLAGGLIPSGGDKWRTRRRLLNPTFHNRILEDNIGNFWKNTRFMTQCMLNNCATGPIKLKDYLNPCALDIICETAMGVSLNAQSSKNQDFTNAIQRYLEALLFRVLNPYLKREWMWKLTPHGRRSTEDIKTLHNYGRNVIRQRMANYSSAKTPDQSDMEDGIRGKKLQPFMDKLLELNHHNPGSWTEDDVHEEVNSVLFAGHDTSSGTSVYALWILGHHPEIQEKAYEELYEIFGEDDREVMMEDLQKMIYLEKIIKETLRILPIVPVIMRQLSQDLHLAGKPSIPAGANVLISPFLLHRNDKYYPNPDTFDPERFGREECATRHPFAYIPFSAGPRSCIGQKFAMLQLKVILSTVLRFCKITSVTKYEEVKFIPAVVLHSTVPIEVRVEPRLTERPKTPQSLGL